MTFFRARTGKLPNLVIMHRFAHVQWFGNKTNSILQQPIVLLYNRSQRTFDGPFFMGTRNSSSWRRPVVALFAVAAAIALFYTSKGASKTSQSDGMDHVISAASHQNPGTAKQHGDKAAGGASALVRVVCVSDTHGIHRRDPPVLHVPDGEVYSATKFNLLIASAIPRLCACPAKKLHNAAFWWLTIAPGLAFEERARCGIVCTHRQNLLLVISCN